MRTEGLAAVLCALSLAGTASEASTVKVQVDAASGPWQVAANAKLMPYGDGSEKPSTVVPLDVSAGKLEIFADGQTSVAGHGGIDPAGLAGKAVDDTLAPHKRRYPSFYTPKVLYPANLHALMGAFVDAKGVVVGRPFVVGTGVRVPVPDDAVGLSLGFNDASFAGASGTLAVVVNIPD